MSDHGEKQVAGGVDGLDGARAQTEAHQAPEFGDKYLDDTQVVQHHDCRVEENDSRHHLKGRAKIKDLSDHSLVSKLFQLQSVNR